MAKKIEIKHILRGVTLTRCIGLVLFLLLLIWSCASTGYPQGGPKDEDPPVMLRSVPPINSLNFQGKEITIYFDEIIQVKDIFQKLVVSPPMNKRPIVTTRGKILSIVFEEELQSNTTYTLDFADAIADNNEGNILENFRFSFATGLEIDSLTISGYLFNASDLAPVAGAFIMAYNNLSDTAFTTQVPVRLAKTALNGSFSLQNMAEGEYRIYALEDANRNFFYDQPGERIAWLPELITPTMEYRERIDSIAPDSVSIHKYQVFLPDSLELFIFQEDNAAQYLKDRKRQTRNKIDFIFNRSLTEPLRIEAINPKATKDWFIYEKNMFNDSITLWLTDTTFIKSDSLFVELGYFVKDSLDQFILKKDTLNAFFFDTSGAAATQRRGRRSEANKDEIEKIEMLQHDPMKRSLELLGEFDINFPTPIANFDLSMLNLFHQVDTNRVPVKFSFIQDTIRIRRYVINHPWQPGERYYFTADSTAFTDIYGLHTDAINHAVSIKTTDSYGEIYIDIENPQDNWLLQVLNRQEKLVRQAYIPNNGKIAFRFLSPGEYFLRIIEDNNRNGEWDTGNYSEKIQPEKIYYYPETVNIRANWEIFMEWNPNEFDIYDFVERHRKKKK
ncbi:MAG: Ig-like domain-containing protein [Marinilabiliaceae bacterium]|nr:Ig-like domain-containing protein [Marinilabiliaceae bacterium]